MSDLGASPYDFCLRFFVELKALGVTDVVVSPGSRSTPLAISARTVGLATTVQIDERVAAFHALGLARATRRPTVLICTSGTAAANYHPAVIEAHHSSVPLIVCTADRPPELRLWGAGQTIDQNNLYGSSVRWFHEVSVGGEVDADHAGSLALRAVHIARGDGGPVHLNWPFREPLQPTADLAPPVAVFDGDTEPLQSRPSEILSGLAEGNERGLIVVGPADLQPWESAEVLEFSARHGWPVVADPASGLRTGGSDSGAVVVTTGELLFASESFTRDLPACEVVVHVGPSPTSKAYRLWLERRRPADLLLVDPAADWSDPTNSTTRIVAGPLPGLFEVESEGEGRRSAWTGLWEHAEATATRAIAGSLAGTRSELAAVDELLGQLAIKDSPHNLVVSSSMPIRDLDVVMRCPPNSIRVIANRGANGIDGVIATAIGVAAGSDAETFLLIGDVATVHDLGGLAAVPRLGVENLTIIVIDNDGGGIFSFLPVASAIEPETFAELFTTAHGTDLAAVAEALGFAVTVVASGETFGLPATSGRQPDLVVVKTAAADTVQAMADVRSAVALAFT